MRSRIYKGNLKKRKKKKKKKTKKERKKKKERKRKKEKKEEEEEEVYVKLKEYQDVFLSLFYILVSQRTCSGPPK